MTEQRNAAIYVRISRDRVGAGLGVERQEEDCRTLAKRLGWRVADIYVDNDISAYQQRKPRQEYKRLLRDLRDGRVNAVLAWHTDRLHRRVTDLEELITLIEDRDVAVSAFTMGDIDLSTASGRRNARINVSIAQGEVEQTRERVRRAKQQAAAAGKYRGGPRPYGYEKDGVTIRMDEAEHVRFATVGVVDGRSLRSLAREMNEAGARTIRGHEWDPVALKNVILRPRNAGLLEHGGEILGTAAWPAIVDEHLWRTAVSVLTNPSRQTNAANPGRERKWLGSGLYVCGLCKRNKVHTTMRVTGNKRSGNHYVCRTSKHVTRDQAQLDEYIRTTIAARLRRKDAANLLEVRADDPTAQLEQDAEVLRRRLRQVESDYDEGLIDGRRLKAATIAAEERLAEVEAKIASHRRGNGLAKILRSPDPAAAFLASTVEEQAVVLDALMVVTVNKGSHGRPAGWVPGDPYFNPAHIKIWWRGTPEEEDDE